MATWTNITDAALEPGRPIRSVDGLALRDNAIAIAEGAVGAPRVENAAFDDLIIGAEKLQAGATEINWVLARTASASVGSVGSYAMLSRSDNSSAAIGATLAGSVLRYAGAIVDLFAEFNAAPNVDSNSGTAPAGTWRCMGFLASSQSGSAGFGDSSFSAKFSTLWLRIS